MKRRARGSGEILKVGDVWKIRYTLHGKRVKEAAGPRRNDAVELLARRLGPVAGGPTVGVAGLMWSDLEHIILDEHRRLRSYGKVERHLRKHLRRYFAGMRAQAITHEKLVRYKRGRLSEGAAPNTVKYELSLANTGLKVAHRAGRLRALPPLPAVQVQNVRKPIFSRDEYQALLQYLPPAAAAVATFMYWTGWRLGETLTREWRHVDFPRKTIGLEAGGGGRLFPFGAVPELTALLERQREYTDACERRNGRTISWVFHRSGRRVISIRAAWRSACRKAKVAGKLPRDFRRSAALRLERDGVPRPVARQLVGLRSDAVFGRHGIRPEAP